MTERSWWPEGVTRDLLVEAYRAFEDGRYESSTPVIADWARAHADDPKAETWFYDAALGYKFLRDWPRAYELGKEAAARAERGAEDPAFWNLGISATIVGDWVAARDAWRGYGINLPDGTGEIVENLGMTCVRIELDDHPEVVWAQRLCPARARVVSVPTPRSGRRFGEIVVHDGEPQGYREVGAQTVPVFNELLVWRESELPTVSVTVTAAERDDVRALTDTFTAAGYGAETADSVNVVCACCSVGTVEQQHAVHAGPQVVWLAAPLDAARALLEEWARKGSLRRGWQDLKPAR